MPPFLLSHTSSYPLMAPFSVTGGLFHDMIDAYICDDFPSIDRVDTLLSPLVTFCDYACMRTVHCTHLMFCVYTCAFSTTHVYTPHIHSSKSTPLLDYAWTVVLKQSLLSHSSYTHSQLYCLSLYIIKHFPIHPSCVMNRQRRRLRSLHLVLH